MHPGVNIIVGNSDSGKSAIIRALKWLVLNRPGGEAFRSHWGGNTHVGVEFDDYHISRNKGDVNSYVLREASEEEVVDFTAFKTEVPEEVVRALNMSPVNYQFQGDQSFLLSNSPGEVANHFNAIANIGQINAALSNLNSRILSVGRELENTTREIEQLGESMNAYDHLPKFEAELEVLEMMVGDFKRLGKTNSKLVSILNQLTELDKELVNRDQIQSIINLIESIEDWYNKRRQIQQDIDKLTVVMDGLVELDLILASQSKLDKLMVDYETYVLFAQTRDSLQKDFSNLSAILTRMDDVLRDQVRDERELARFEKIYHDNFPEQCPLCNH